MEKYLDLVLKNPIKALLFLAAMTVILGSGIAKIEFDSSLEQMMPKKDSAYILHQKVKETYGNNGQFIIICVSTDDAVDSEFLSKLNEFHLEIEEYEWTPPEKEDRRLEILKDAASRAPIGGDELLALFEDDSVFQNYLERRIADLNINTDVLTSTEIDHIIKRFKQSRDVRQDYLVDLIVSPLTMQDLIGEDNTLISYDLIETDDYGNRIIPETDEELAVFEDRLRNNPAFEGGIYVQDEKTGKITDFGIMVRLIDVPDYDPIVIEIQDIASGYKNDLDITLQGVPVVYHEINEYMKGDLKRFLPLVFLVVIVIFFLNFRSIRGVILPFATLVLADIWIMGLIGHLGFKLTIVGISLPTLMTAVGSSYSIHILNQYYMELDDIKKLGLFDGLKSAMSHISLTVTLAGVTTFLGFFMLVTNQVSSIREMGLFSAIGVLFAVFISITLIPAVLVMLKLDTRKPEKSIIPIGGPVDKIIAVFTRWSLDHSRMTIIVMCVIMAVSFIGLTRIQVETSVHAYFKKDDPVLESSKLIGEKFGGSYGLNILIETDEFEGALEPELLEFVEEFRVWLEAEENIDLNIGRTDSFTDFVKSMHLAMHDNDFEYYKIPEERIDVESYVSIYPGRDDRDTGIPDDFEPYIDWQYSTLNLFARIWEREGKLISSSIMEHLIGKTSLYLDENLPAEYTYQISGEPKILVKMSNYVVRGQIMSLFFSLIAVSIIVLLLFRNWRAGAVAVIPITTAVLFNFGVMGWLGIRLDIATAIIASITIGIGVDDTIHFLNNYRRFKSLDMSMRESVAATLQISGRAIIYTSLALTFGFMVLVVSSFKPVIYFGILIACTMVAATVGALLFLPAVIKAFNIKLSPPENDSWFWKYADLSRFLAPDKDNNKK